jgi:phage-related holin
MKNIDLLALITKALAWVLVITLPIRPAMIAVCVIILADFATGVWASLKEGKPITSNKFRNTLSKILGYQILIVAAFILEKYLLDGLPAVKAVTAMIGVTEGKSLFENIHRITGIDIWSQVVSRLNLQDIKNDSDKPENK